MNLDPETEQAITEQAASDSGFAIAAALLELASATRDVAYQLQCLGTGNASTQMGAVEFLATELKAGLQAISEHRT